MKAQQLLVRTTIRLSAWCPRLVRVAFSHLVARGMTLFSLQPARVTKANLAWCFPQLSDRERKALTTASLAETMQLVLEAGMTFHWSEQALENETLRVVGAEGLEAALDSGRGVLLLVPHFGNWEFLALYLGRYQLVALYDPPRSESLDLRLRQARQRTGASLLPLDNGGLRAAYRTLAQGGLLGVLPDQVPDRRSGIHVPFFYQSALTMTLVHRLARKFSPMVFMGSATRTANGFEIELTNLGEVLNETDPRKALSGMNRAIESLITKAPAQYQWEYKRFKSPPQGVARLY